MIKAQQSLKLLLNKSSYIGFLFGETLLILLTAIQQKTEHVHSQISIKGNECPEGYENK